MRIICAVDYLLVKIVCVKTTQPKQHLSVAALPIDGVAGGACRDG
jgi:hypothetical protein